MLQTGSYDNGYRETFVPSLFTISCCICDSRFVLCFIRAALRFDFFSRSFNISIFLSFI
jgi:hypothetical protein